MAGLVRHPTNGIDAASLPAARNVVFSVQPVIPCLDGQASRLVTYPAGEELWEIPGAAGYWRGVPAIPRSEHHTACPLFRDLDIPYTLNTDPPSVRDPRPALTLVGAVARCPVEIDPTRWLDQSAPGGVSYPRDYLVNGVYLPLGQMASGPTNINPMQLTVEEALCDMTFWGGYAAGQEREVGALAAPRNDSGEPGWFADFVVWEYNPLAIRGSFGRTLEDAGVTPVGMTQTQKVDTVNAFIEKFRPALTVVGGVPVYVSPVLPGRWQSLIGPP
jgi:hypothetical protein